VPPSMERSGLTREAESQRWRPTVDVAAVRVSSRIMNEQALRERIDQLREALERIRDRDPQEEAIEGASLGTSGSAYAAETRMIAENALATDDVRREAAFDD